MFCFSGQSSNAAENIFHGKIGALRLTRFVFMLFLDMLKEIMLPTDNSGKTRIYD